MKKAILMMLTLLALPALAVTVTVDGRTLPDNPSPILSEGRVLVPLRAVFQALDAKVDYQNSTITATREGKTIVLKPNQSTALVDGTSVKLDAPARLANGTTYVPLRFVAQALGEKVAWESGTKTVVIGEGVAVYTPSGEISTVALEPMLKRLVVGNQGGVLKVWDQSKSTVVYYRGLDDRSVAPLSALDQQAILTNLNLTGDLNAVSRQLMNEYKTLPQKEALAMLGVMNSIGDNRISPQTSSEIRSFLVNTMLGDSSVYNRRQATLSLAVGASVEPSTVNAVVGFYQGSENLWETFPVQQFFEYHAQRVRQMPNFAALKNQVLSVNSLYRSNISSYLGGELL